MTMNSFLLLGGIGVAGASGAVVRYLSGRWIARWVARVPLGTLLINITGAFLIGLIFALTAQELVSSGIQSILATGFLGGYTTFGTMKWEGLQLAQERSLLYSFLYLGTTYVLGLSAEMLGMFIGRGW